MVGGHEYYEENPDLSASKDFEKGDEILLAYNEQKPDESIIIHKETDSILYVRFAFAALIEIILVYLLFKTRSK